MTAAKGVSPKPSLSGLFMKQPCIGRGCNKIIQRFLECNYITMKKRCGCPDCHGCGEEKQVGPFCQKCYEAITSTTFGKETS